jgi:hypothetical protein
MAKGDRIASPVGELIMAACCALNAGAALMRQMNHLPW